MLIVGNLNKLVLVCVKFVTLFGRLLPDDLQRRQGRCGKAWGGEMRIERQRPDADGMCYGEAAGLHTEVVVSLPTVDPSRHAAAFLEAMEAAERDELRQSGMVLNVACSG